MKMLRQSFKDKMFLKGAEYAVRANESHRQLCDLVSDDMGRELVWRESEDLPTPKAAIGPGYTHGKGKPRGILIVTAPCHRDPAMVSFVLAHEVAHFVLEHYTQGSFLFGYTTREAEADAFSFAFLYGTAQSDIPCGGILPYHAIYTAIKTVYHDEPEFFWPQETRLADIRTIRGFLEQLGNG